MNISALRERINTVTVLSFADGEEVEALLLNVDADAHEDLTYELRRILRPAVPRALGSDVGSIVVAPLSELVAWRAL